MAQEPTANREGVADLLEATLTALEDFDATALQALLTRAEEFTAGNVSAAELESSRPQHRALGELLAATERNLKMLRRLRGEELPGERAPWVL